MVSQQSPHRRLGLTERILDKQISQSRTVLLTFQRVLHSIAQGWSAKLDPFSPCAYQLECHFSSLLGNTCAIKHPNTAIHPWVVSPAGYPQCRHCHSLLGQVATQSGGLLLCPLQVQCLLTSTVGQPVLWFLPHQMPAGQVIDTVSTPPTHLVLCYEMPWLI